MKHLTFCIQMCTNNTMGVYLTFCNIWVYIRGRHSGVAVSIVAVQQEAVGFKSWFDAFLCGICRFSLCLHGFFVGTPVSSHSPKTTHSSINWRLKITPRCDCVCKWCPVVDSRPMIAGRGSSNPRNLNQVNRKWMDGMTNGKCVFSYFHQQFKRIQTQFTPTKIQLLL